MAFAHRGARAHAPENTLEAFELALRLGANGLETDAWITRDRQVVLDHDGVLRRRLRRLPVSRCDRSDLPGHVPSLAEFFARVGTNFELSIDVKDLAAYEAIVAETARAGFDPARLWLCHPDADALIARRAQHPEVRQVCSTKFKDLGRSAEGRIAAWAGAGLDAVNMRHSDWNGGLCALVHRFGLHCLAWDVQHDDRLRAVLRMGMDGLFSDHVDRMVDAYRDEIGHLPPR